MNQTTLVLTTTFPFLLQPPTGRHADHVFCISASEGWNQLLNF